MKGNSMNKRNVDKEIKKLLKNLTFDKKEKLIALWTTYEIGNYKSQNCVDKELIFQREGNLELNKKTKKLVYDIIREANTLPGINKVAGPEQNLDIIKHLIKRLAVHQIILEEKAKILNKILIILSIIMSIGAIASIINVIY